MCDAALCNSSACNTYVSYVHQKLALLKSVRANWCDRDLIELIIHGILEFKTRDCLIMHDFENISDLIAYLSTVTKPTKPSDFVYHNSSSLSKRPCLEETAVTARSYDSRVCFHCGKAGHVKQRCRSLLSSSNVYKQTQSGLSIII